MSPTRMAGPVRRRVSPVARRWLRARRLLAGVIADLLGLSAAIYTVAAITAISGLVVAIRMYETHPRGARTAPALDGVDLES